MTPEQEAIEAAPFDPNVGEFRIRATEAGMVRAGDDVIVDSLIRRVHATRSGEYATSVKFDLGDRWAEFEWKQPVYVVTVLNRVLAEREPEGEVLGLARCPRAHGPEPCDLCDSTGWVPSERSGHRINGVDYEGDGREWWLYRGDDGRVYAALTEDLGSTGLRLNEKVAVVPAALAERGAQEREDLEMSAKLPGDAGNDATVDPAVIFHRETGKRSQHFKPLLRGEGDGDMRFDSHAADRTSAQEGDSRFRQSLEESPRCERASAQEKLQQLAHERGRSMEQILSDAQEIEANFGGEKHVADRELNRDGTLQRVGGGDWFPVRCQEKTWGGQQCERPFRHLDHCHFAPLDKPPKDSVLRAEGGPS